MVETKVLPVVRCMASAAVRYTGCIGELALMLIRVAISAVGTLKYETFRFYATNFFFCMAFSAKHLLVPTYQRIVCG